jgi:hypothetical protein
MENIETCCELNTEGEGNCQRVARLHFRSAVPGPEDSMVVWLLRARVQGHHTRSIREAMASVGKRHEAANVGLPVWHHQ